MSCSSNIDTKQDDVAITKNEEDAGTAKKTNRITNASSEAKRPARDAADSETNGRVIVARDSDIDSEVDFKEIYRGQGTIL